MTHEIRSGLVSISTVGECASSTLARDLTAALQAAPPDTKVLIDLRSSTWAPSSDDLRQLAAIIGSRAPEIGGRVALLVSSELHYGLGRMLGIYLESFPIQFDVFRRREDALKYLSTVDPHDLLTAMGK